MQHTLIPLFLASLLLSGCQKPATQASAETAPATDFSPWFVASPPAGARPVHEVREDAVPGDEVVLTGRIMGRANPFVDGRAAFVVGDTTLLTPCNERPDDQCETPWDVCCNDKAAIRSGTATVQIVGENGRVLPHGLKGVNGLAELSTVTITGTVAETSTPDALVINATALHVAN
jgi:hypothetical protein